MLGNAARLWAEAQPAQKRRLQGVLFPEGLRLQGGKFETAVSCFAFTQSAATDYEKSGVASPRATERLWTFDRQGLIAA